MSLKVVDVDDDSKGILSITSVVMLQEAGNNNKRWQNEREEKILSKMRGRACVTVRKESGIILTLQLIIWRTTTKMLYYFITTTTYYVVFINYINNTCNTRTIETLHTNLLQFLFLAFYQHRQTFQLDFSN
jgi:hypothetical protein